MSNKYFGAIALTGGGTGAVDAIAVALLSEGDILKVVSDTYEYAYNYSASEAGSEDSPRIIIPDDNVSGTGAWVLRGATPFYLQGKGGDIASASPLVIDTDGDYFDVTGTTGFAAMTVVANRHFFLQFDGALVMTHHATNLDLPGEANITTVAGDVAEFFSTGSNTVQCVNYTRADGTAIDSGSVATDAIWDAAGDFAVGTGANTAAKKTTTEVSALLVDVVQAADLSIADNDTLALTFDFVPSKIIISYSLREAHITSFEEGFAVGHCVVTITGTDTFTSVLNYADFYDKNGAFGATYGNGDTTNIVQGYGGYNGANYGQLDGTGAWV
ncbi:hypothetical protein H8E88_24560, partial [candidate division KSB1 bacterium]|nr:hypothetical protein [candidate division KSB1 bacterium]